MTDTKLTAPLPNRAPTGPDASGLAALEVLLSRSSNNMLTDPAPDGSYLDLILQAASRAPDHGRLCPWRFVVIRGAAREAFTKLLREAGTVWLDLGGIDTQTAPGIARFKLGLGGEVVTQSGTYF